MKGGEENPPQFSFGGDAGCGEGGGGTKRMRGTRKGRAFSGGRRLWELRTGDERKKEREEEFGFVSGCKRFSGRVMPYGKTKRLRLNGSK